MPMVRCLDCSHENEEDAKFCIVCGNSLEAEGDVVSLTAKPTVKESLAKEGEVKPVPRVSVITPTAPTTRPAGPPRGMVRVSPPGMCFYHELLPASSVCGRCGRSVCRYCSKTYIELNLCPQCYAGVVPRQ